MNKKNAILILALSSVAILVTIFVVWRSGDLTGGLTSKKAAGDCLVLEEKYCDSGKILQYEGFEHLGFNLPPGTPIFAPFDGQFSSGDVTLNGKTYNFVGVTKNPDLHAPEHKGFSVRGAVEPEIQPDSFQRAPVKAGEIIAFVGSENANLPGEYNIMISMDTFDSELRYLVPNTQFLREFFRGI